jgi:AraC-like DNA-binding protein
LDRARIPGQLVESGGWLSKVQVYGFLHDVVQRERCEELGFASYNAFHLAVLGPVAGAMYSAPTMKASLDVFCRMAGRSYEGNKFWLAADGDDIWFCGRVVDSAGDGHAYAQHGSLMVLTQIVRAAADSGWWPRRVRLQAPRTSALHRTNGLHESRAQFNQDHTAVAIPRQLLSRRLADVGAKARGERSLEGIPDEQESFSASLQRLLKSQFPHARLPTLEEAADIAGTSGRTLKRRLFGEGVAYREILDRVRFEFAQKRLEDADLPVGDIARELGYSGPNNFVRAFKRVAGMTPTEYRRRHSK